MFRCQACYFRDRRSLKRQSVLTAKTLKHDEGNIQVDLGKKVKGNLKSPPRVSKRKQPARGAAKLVPVIKTDDQIKEEELDLAEPESVVSASSVPETLAIEQTGPCRYCSESGKLIDLSIPDVYVCDNCGFFKDMV